jgi:glycosyltransferase involved in cell wall biosynthesis
MDVCLRARELGYRVVYEPAAVVTHLESRTKQLLGMDRFNLRDGVENYERKGRRLFLDRWRERIIIDEDDLRAEDGFVPPSEALHIMFTMYGWEHEGGGTILPRQLALALAERGHLVTVLSASPEPRPGQPAYWLSPRVDRGVQVIELFNRPAAFNNPDHPELEGDDPTARHIVRTLVEQLAPDVVHYHSLIGFSLTAAIDVDRLGVPSVFTSHNYWPICPRLYLFNPDLSPCGAAGGRCSCGPAATPYALRAAQGQVALAGAIDRHLAVSHRVRELYISNGHDPDRIVVFHQQPQTADQIWDVVGSRRQPAAPLDRPLRVGFIGSVLPHKGVHVLAHALQQLPPGSVECTVYGAGPAAYLDVLRGIDAAGAMRFQGGYATAELPSLLGEVDVCVVPSVWEDCAPLVVAEALAARLPVVGSHAGGIPDFVDDGVTGMLFPMGDAVALAAALRRLVDEPKLLGALQAAIGPPRRFDDFVSDLVTHYRSVIEDRYPPCEPSLVASAETV